jgi:hypothetical protein
MMAIQHKPELVAALKTGIEWLQSEQPPDALLSHHGLYLQDSAAKPLQLTYIRIAPSSFRDDRPVIIFETAYGEDFKTGASFQYALTAEDVTALETMITEAGGVIDHHWNGAGASTVSFAIRNSAGPSVMQAVRNMAARDFREPIVNNSIIRPANWR